MPAAKLGQMIAAIWQKFTLQISRAQVNSCHNSRGACYAFPVLQTYRTIP